MNGKDLNEGEKIEKVSSGFENRMMVASGSAVIEDYDEKTHSMTEDEVSKELEMMKQEMLKKYYESITSEEGIQNAK